MNLLSGEIIAHSLGVLEIDLILSGDNAVAITLAVCSEDGIIHGVVG